MPRTDEKNIEHGKFVKPIYYKKSGGNIDEAREKSSTFKKVPPPPPIKWSVPYLGQLHP
jgi:hypothetical protein